MSSFSRHQLSWAYFRLWRDHKLGGGGILDSPEEAVVSIALLLKKKTACGLLYILSLCIYRKQHHSILCSIPQISG